MRGTDLVWLALWFGCAESTLGDVKLPAELQGESLLLWLESPEVNAKEGESVLRWKDLSQRGKDAVANASHKANELQRAENAQVDGTRISDEQWSLPMAKSRVEAGLADSAPLLVTCPVLEVPALQFDGDDCLAVALDGPEDPLVPGAGGITVFAMMSLAEYSDAQTQLQAWVGLGNPGFFSDSQYMLVANPGKSGPGFATVRVVPVAHDPRRPTVRESVVLDAKLSDSRPTLVTFTVDGKKVEAFMNGEDEFEPQSRHGKPPSSRYQGGINPLADDPDSFFRIGTGPSCDLLYTGQGAVGNLYAVMVYKGRLSGKKRKAVESYLGCRFGVTDLCPESKAEL
mmetsp:Transcript_20111/g.36388  ORF Transcript_20111/g.36388 Transcript_20111/m.36388 type:complete len:342 (+) Transcript_20111:62-1087(+)